MLFEFCQIMLLYSLVDLSKCILRRTHPVKKIQGSADNDQSGSDKYIFFIVFTHGKLLINAGIIILKIITGLVN